MARRRPNMISRAMRAAFGGAYSSAHLKPSGLFGGGFMNPMTGAGTHLDKSEASIWMPTHYYSRHQLETLYVQSWAARKFVDLPVDDCFIRWREWGGEDDRATEAMRDAEERHRVRDSLSRAMRAGRLYGTALLVLVTRDAPPEQPLNIEHLRPGDLVSLQVFDRYSLSVFGPKDQDLRSPTYGEPQMWQLNPAMGMPGTRIHPSRVIRFDGIRPLGADGWTVYERDWGISEIVPAILAISQDAEAAAGAAHLSSEASIPFMKVQGFREALESGGDPTEATPEKIGEAVSQLKSIYRTMFLDVGDDFGRVAVSWSGLPDIMDRFARRLAACADIPETRFWGRSPAGLNATGDSDMQNYAIMIAAKQEHLRLQLMLLDMVLARDAGIPEPPEYEWPSLIDISDAEQAGTLGTKAQAFGGLIQAGIIDEDEARMSIASDPCFPDGLAGEAPLMSSQQAMQQYQQDEQAAQQQENVEADRDERAKEADAAAKQKPPPAKDKKK